METSSNLRYLCKTVCRTTKCLKLEPFVLKENKTTTWQNILTIWPKAWVETESAFLNLPKLVCVVNNIEGTSICSLRKNLCETLCANVVFLKISVKNFRRNCHLARNLRLVFKRYSLCKTACATVNLFKLTFYLQICFFCAKQCAQVRIARN